MCKWGIFMLLESLEQSHLRKFCEIWIFSSNAGILISANLQLINGRFTTTAEAELFDLSWDNFTTSSTSSLRNHYSCPPRTSNQGFRVLKFGGYVYPTNMEAWRVLPNYIAYLSLRSCNMIGIGS